MQKKLTKKRLGIGLGVLAIVGAALISSNTFITASSHREAPLIANDALADNTDLYAFRSPNDQNTVTIIANYIPAELPQGGPNYYSFGEDVRHPSTARSLSNSSSQNPSALHSGCFV